MLQLSPLILVSTVKITNIDKINMENDCAFAKLEDKYTFKFKEKQKVAVEFILHAPLDIIYKHLLSSSYFTRHSNMLQLSPLILVSTMKIQNMLQLPPSIVCLVTYIYSINNSFGMTIVILQHKYVN
jgi:hypothetical protein